MKILHTADLHLGKILYETSQLDCQKKMLEDIHQILLKDDYAALILAGDIYDRSIPPSSAVTLFDEFLSAVSRDCPNTAIFIIPGNHDSAERLSFAANLLKRNNIYIAADTKNLCTPIIISQNGEKVQFFLLPFLHLGSFSHLNIEKKLNSQKEMAEIASALLKDAIDPSIPSVLVGHLFTLGGQKSSSERVFLGTSEFIPPELINFFTYTALGHLHKFQKVKDRVYYSGAPLSYAFDECKTEKVVLSVDIDCKTEGFPIQIEKIPIEPLRKMSRLEGEFNDFFNSNKYNEYKNHFLEITLTNNVLIENPMSLLQNKFPYLLNLKQKAVEAQIRKDNVDSAEMLTKNIEDPNVILENFVKFEHEIEEPADDKKLECFKNLFKELEEGRE